MAFVTENSFTNKRVVKISRVEVISPVGFSYNKEAQSDFGREAKNKRAVEGFNEILLLLTRCVICTLSEGQSNTCPWLKSYN